jgi:hypothetical protein
MSEDIKSESTNPFVAAGFGCFLHGHEIILRDGKWFYKDTGKSIVDEEPRACPKCGRKPEKVENIDGSTDYRDGCLRRQIPGAIGVCCGHGVRPPQVVTVDVSRVLSESEAMALIAEAQKESGMTRQEALQYLLDRGWIGCSEREFGVVDKPQSVMAHVIETTEGIKVCLYRYDRHHIGDCLRECSWEEFKKASSEICECGYYKDTQDFRSRT